MDAFAETQDEVQFLAQGAQIQLDVLGASERDEGPDHHTLLRAFLVCNREEASADEDDVLLIAAGFG